MSCQEAKPRTYSGRSFVDVVEPVQHRTRLDRASYWPWPRFRRLQLERSMRSLLVVVPHELIEDGRQMPLIKHDHVVEALAAERPDDSFGDGVRLGRVNRRGDSIDTDTPGAPKANAIAERDRKSTRLNSSHGYISYAVFCLKKKKKN